MPAMIRSLTSDELFYVGECRTCPSRETCTMTPRECKAEWDAEKADRERDEQMMKGASR